MDIIKEIHSCQKSVPYFLQNYCKLQHPSAGIIPFYPFKYQIKAVNCFQKFKYNIVRKCRQCGISQISGAFALHQGMFFPHQTILIISKKEDDAKTFLKRNIGFLYENLPDWMKEMWEPIKWNEHEIEFPNYSSIKSLTSSPNVLRSHASSLNIIDEAAFIPNMDAMWASGWSCVIGETLLSTINGLIRIKSLVKTKDQWQDIDIQVKTDNGLKKADKVFLSGETPIKTITTESGLTISGTGTHRLRTITPNGNYDWLYLENACPGQYVVIKLGDKPELQEINPELYFAGLILPRGVKSGNEIHTRFNSRLVTPKFTQLCEEFFGPNGYEINKRQFKIKSSKIFDIIEKYDIDIKSTPANRIISDKILELGRNNYYHVICGIIDAQSASGKRIGSIFDSKKMAHDIQNIIFDYGFPVTVNETSQNQSRLVISDSEFGAKYFDHFYTTRSDLILWTESGQSLNTDHPIMVYLFEQECSILTSENPGDKSINKCGSYGRIRYNSINDMLRYNIGDVNAWLVSKGLFVDKIVSVKNDVQETFDIQVPGEHCYVSNTFISHNTLQHGGKVIVISTLNGIGDWYYKTMMGAINKTNNFNLIEINWHDMDWAIEYKDKSSGQNIRIAPCDGIRPCTTQAEIDKYGNFWSPWLEEQWRGLADDGESWKFDQEVLARVVSSGKTVLGSLNINNIANTVCEPAEKKTGYLSYTHPVTRKPVSLDFNFEEGFGLWVWEKPVRKSPDFPEGHDYVIGVDTMTGRGDDYNGIQIFCVQTKRQVAEMYMRCIPKLLAAYIDMLGRHYNYACVNVERNNGGDTVVDELRLEYGYTNLWRRVEIKDQQNPEPKIHPAGYFTNDINKIKINKLLNNLAGTEDGVTIKSPRLLEQLQTYINLRDASGRLTGKTGAETGCHDDLVMGFGLTLVAMVSNPDPSKSIMVPISSNSDLDISSDGPTPQSLDYGQYNPNVIAPISGNYVDEIYIESNVNDFARSLISPPTVIQPVVAKKKYY